MDTLADRFHLIAVDSYGAGKSPEWPSAERIQLADEVALVAPLLATLTGPVFLVGHSYGAAVALKAALGNPSRCAGLALYEPTFFSVVDAAQPPPNDADGIRIAAGRAAAKVRAGDIRGGGQGFIDYWMGQGTWDRMPPERQAPVADSTRNIARWAHALFHERATLQDLSGLRMPVLYMTGTESPRSSLAVADLVVPVLSSVQHVRFEGLGHMGPVTHPAVVNEAIATFLDQVGR
jgi:pimeloyl-ACP methyl ester carboxylesterase